ncbi:MAG: 2-phosphosulfolactate phosphatase [Actinobacteria bacterium]|nr:2-phosphosulfolactate phosphatase [Actinomycetota bacterium]
MATVVIDCFPASVARYVSDHAIVAVDVIRATTTAQTAVALGRRCFPVPTLENALATAAELEDPLLMGELGGSVPFGFELQNSPAALAAQPGNRRPVVLLSTSGTQVLHESRGAEAAYAASLRNVEAQSRAAARHERVAIVGAGARGEFREEDQLCAAWIASRLVQLGHQPENEQTESLIAQWGNEPVEAFLNSNSVEYLRRTDQLRDLDFILAHVDDLTSAFALSGSELIELPGMS